MDENPIQRIRLKARTPQRSSSHYRIIKAARLGYSTYWLLLIPIPQETVALLPRLFVPPSLRVRASRNQSY